MSGLRTHPNQSIHRETSLTIAIHVLFVIKFNLRQISLCRESVYIIGLHGYPDRDSLWWFGLVRALPLELDYDSYHGNAIYSFQISHSFHKSFICDNVVVTLYITLPRRPKEPQSGAKVWVRLTGHCPENSYKKESYIRTMKSLDSVQWTGSEAQNIWIQCDIKFLEIIWIRTEVNADRRWPPLFRMYK